MITNLSEVKQKLQLVIEQVDHKNIDLDVLFFENRPSTIENIAIFFWKELKPLLPLLSKVRVHETDKNISEYYE